MNIFGDKIVKIKERMFYVSAIKRNAVALLFYEWGETESLRSQMGLIFTYEMWKNTEHTELSHMRHVFGNMRCTKMSVFSY
jgi:hypothetical protein